MNKVIDINITEVKREITLIDNGNRLIINVNNIYNSGGGSGGAVDSVNGQTGVVVLTTNEVADSSNKRYVSDTEKTAIAHSNRSILDAITESFTTALKTAYDASVTWISTNGTNLINHLSNTSNPHNTTASQVGAYTSGQTDTLLNAKANVSGQVFTGAISATNLSNTNTGDETTLSIQTKRPLKTVNNVSLEGSGNASLKVDVRHFFPFNHTFTASTSWFTFARESASLYDLAFWTSTAYNGTTVLDNRIVKFPLPYNCKLKNVQIIYTSVSTTVDIRLLYFECISNSSSVINQTTLGSISIASNPSQVQQIVDFTTQDKITSLASGGFVTIAMFNNNISAGLMRNVTIIVDFEPI